MNVKILIKDFLKITGKKAVLTILFPIMAISILLFVFVLDAMLGLGGSIIINTMYSFANCLYLFILMPLTFVEIDFSSSLVFGVAFVLTVIWWYFLSCAIIFLLEKAGKRKKTTKNR